MKGQLGVAGAAVALAIAVILHSSSPSTAPQPRHEPLPSQAAPASAAVERPAPSPSATLALRLEESLSRSSNDDSSALTSELIGALRADPRGWKDVFDILKGEPVPVRRTVLARLGEAVTPATEPALIERMTLEEDRETRLAIVRLLSDRPSPASFGILLARATEDPDHGVRYSCLQAVAARKGQGSPDQDAVIDRLIEGRAKLDADPEVRRLALNLSGKSAPPPAPRPAQVRRQPLELGPIEPSPRSGG
jgi:HEAT repeat protein